MIVSGSGIRNKHESQVRHQLGNVRAEDVGEELADVLEDRASLLDGRDDAGEVVVEQDQVRRLFRDVGAGDAHGDADVGGLQGRCVVHAVTGDGNDLALRLQGLHDQHLLLGGHAGEQNLLRIEGELQLRRRDRPQLVTGDDDRPFGCDQADLAGDRQRPFAGGRR